MTVGELAERMTEAEFGHWQIYRRQKLMPMRRLEYGLAMIALKVSQWGGGRATLLDFLLDVDGEKEETKPPLETMVRTLTTGKVFRLGQRKKG